MKKKVLAGFLAMMLAATTLFGCGKETTETPASSSKSETVASSENKTEFGNT